MKRRLQASFINLIFPAVIFGTVTGVLTSVIVNLYKLCAKWVIDASEVGYHYIRGHLYWIPAVLLALAGLACLFAFLYRKSPNLRGGGIPTSIGILRGVISFHWLTNLVGIFFLSLTSFLVGVPLGTEGPSVQMGTAIGRGSVFSFAKRHRAWDRYSMTGGACAGFSVATGAPISGVLFAVEEAHQRISPMIVIVSAVSVMASYVTTELLSVFLPVSTTLFPKMQPMALSLRDIWIPIVIGILMGVYAVLFLKYYRLINTFIKKTLKKIPNAVKIFAIFVLTFGLGLISYSFVSTGHELMLTLLDGTTAVYMLLLILAIRATLTLGANSSGITGGIFVPVLALGAVLAALTGELLGSWFGLGQEYYTVILLLGITACIAGMMKMPLTAIVFAIEALACYENILYVIVVAAVAYIMTEIFGVHSVAENVLKNRIRDLDRSSAPRVIDTFVTVKKDSFAVGKQIRDIFWPANLFVLSLHHAEKQEAEVDEHGEKALREGDILHIRYSTHDEEETKAAIMAIVGEQEYPEEEVSVV